MRGRLDGGRVALEVAHRFANRPVRLPTACAGTCWLCSPRRSRAARARRGAAARHRRRRLGRRLRPARRAAARARPALPLPRRPHRGHDRARARARAARGALRGHRHPDHADQHRLPAAGRRGLAGARGRRADRAGARPVRPVADRRAGQRGDRRLHDRAARRPQPDLGARADRAARLPAAPFAGEPVEPGTTLGPCSPPRAASAGAPVLAVAGHDTASAFAAAPCARPNAAVLSSGTWSLLGLELDAAGARRQAPAFNLTNERGVDGTIRLLRNVMGLWLVQECRRGLGRRLRGAPPAGRGGAATCRCSTPTTTRSWPRATCRRDREGLHRERAAAAADTGRAHSLGADLARV